MFFGSFIKFLRGLFCRKPQKATDPCLAKYPLNYWKGRPVDLQRVMGEIEKSATNPTYTWDITYGVPKVTRITGLTVIFNANHKENYGSQELAAKELSNWFGKHVSRRTIYRALKEKNGNLTVGDRTVIVKYMED